MPGGPAATGPGLGANAPKSKFAGILMVSFAAFAGILFGYDTGTISGITAMKDFLRLFGQPTTDLTDHPTGYFITSSQQSLVTSILSAGTFFGKPNTRFPMRQLSLMRAPSQVHSAVRTLQTGSAVAAESSSQPRSSRSASPSRPAATSGPRSSSAVSLLGSASASSPSSSPCTSPSARPSGSVAPSSPATSGPSPSVSSSPPSSTTRPRTATTTLHGASPPASSSSGPSSSPSV